VAVFKRGSNWHYEFEFKGQRIRESTRQGNKRVAEQTEAARRIQLAKGEVGIEERKSVPTLREFASRFEKLVSVQCAEKPKTVAFYLAKLKTLLHDSELGSVRLDAIGEAAVERYIQTRSRTVSRRKRVLSPGSINRELATLRKLLRVAHEWKEIQRIPRIRLLRGERNRDFVLSRQQETIYLAACPDPLADIAMILLDTGLRLGSY